MSPYSSSSAPWFSAMERWSSSHFLTPSRSPLVAALRRMFILLQPSLAQIADNHGLAVLIHSIGELLTGHVDTGSPKAPQILVLKKVPNPIEAYSYTSVRFIHWVVVKRSQHLNGERGNWLKSGGEIPQLGEVHSGENGEGEYR